MGSLAFVTLREKRKGYQPVTLSHFVNYLSIIVMMMVLLLVVFNFGQN